jgi:beta-glucosidase
VVDYHEGLFYGYRGYDHSKKDPLFPFGYGLCYTSFELFPLESFPSVLGHDIVTQITNTGNRDGTSVVQLYVGLSGENTPRPLRELKGFVRVALKAGESKKITIPLPADSLRYWHPVKNCWVGPEGPATLEVGFSERDIRQKLMMMPTNSDGTL